MTVKNAEFEHPQIWLSLALAVNLFFAPWVLDFTAETAAAWTAWGTAVAIIAICIAAIVEFAEWEGWLGLVLGLWLVVAPWLVGFTNVVVARWTHVVLGLLVAAVAAWEVWLMRFHKSAST